MNRGLSCGRGVLLTVLAIVLVTVTNPGGWAGPAQVSKLGVGVASPGADVHIAKGVAASRPSDLTSIAPSLLIENSDPDYSCASMALLSGTGTAGTSNIYFGNAGSSSAVNRGRIRYTNNSNEMSFFAAGAESARLTNSSNVVGLTLTGSSGGLLYLTPYGGFPGGWSGHAGLFAKTDSGVTGLYGLDSAGNHHLCSPHNFSLYTPASEDPAPWSHYSVNTFTGKVVNADISGALRALETLTGQQFLYYADLPAAEVVDPVAWVASETQRLTTEAKRRVLDANPWVVVPFEEAWEEAPEMLKRTVLEPLTKYRINWDTKQVESYVIQVPRETVQATGSTKAQLKPGIRFDESTGQCLRARTLEDVVLPPGAVPVVDLPAYVKARLPR